MEFVDYYAVLEIPTNATNLAIRQGYRRQALKWHPDKNLDNEKEATRKFKVISEAFQVLEDSGRRRDHDYDLKKYHAQNNARRASTGSFSSTNSDTSSTNSDSTNSASTDSSSTNSDSSSTSSDSPGSAFSDSSSSSFSDFFRSTFTDFSNKTPDSPPRPTPRASSNFTFRNPYDVFEEFFGSRCFAKACQNQTSKPFGFDMDLTRNEFGNWKLPDIIKIDKTRRSVVKELEIVNPDGNKTILKTKTVTTRKNGREIGTVSTGFENGILRTTSIIDVTGSQFTTFH